MAEPSELSSDPFPPEPVSPELAGELSDLTGKLCGIPSPTGYTGAVTRFLAEWFTEEGYQPLSTIKGSVLVPLGGEGNPLVLSAHVDTLGAMVRSINSSGTLQLTKLGSYPGNYIEFANCRVHTRDDRVYTGTIRLKNPAVHVNNKISEIKRDDENLEIVLDEMVRSREDTGKLGICHGDIVSLDSGFTITPAGFIKSRHLDDKAGAAVLMSLARTLSGQPLRRKVSLLFTGYEEVGHGGASGFPEDTRDMIAVDMGAVGGDLAADEYKLSICAKDSSGPYDYDLTTELINTAKACNLAYVVDIYPFYSSDADVALRAGRELRHGLVGPGVSASHGYERCHLNGLGNVHALLTNLCM